MEYILNNGWRIVKKQNGIGLLQIKPIPNSIFRTERCIEVPAEVFNDIENGEKDAFSIIKKYNLLDALFQWQAPCTNNTKKTNTENCYQGEDFFVTKEGNKYFLSYLLSRQGGGEGKIEISKEIYNDVRSETLSLSDILKKYDLYKYDKY